MLILICFEMSAWCLILGRGKLSCPKDLITDGECFDLHEPAKEMGSKTNSPGVGVGVLLEHVVCPHCRHSRDEGPGQTGKGFQQGVVNSIRAEANEREVDDIAPAAMQDSTQHLRGVLIILNTSYDALAVPGQSEFPSAH